MKFQKGQSGNPGGRPKKTDEQIQYEREITALTPLAIKRLTGILTSAEDDAPELMKAVTTVLDRSLGKPTQALDLMPNDDDGSLRIVIERGGNKTTNS